MAPVKWPSLVIFRVRVRTPVFGPNPVRKALGPPVRCHRPNLVERVFLRNRPKFLRFGNNFGSLGRYLCPRTGLQSAKVPDQRLTFGGPVGASPYNVNLGRLQTWSPSSCFCIAARRWPLPFSSRAFSINYCDDERRESSIRVHIGAREKAPLSPLEMQIPASSLIAGVQPGRKCKESIVTKEGMIPYKDWVGAVDRPIDRLIDEMTNWPTDRLID